MANKYLKTFNIIGQWKINVKLNQCYFITYPLEQIKVKETKILTILNVYEDVMQQ